MQFSDLKTIERKGNNALKRLRKAKFEKGLPFMLNAKDLPSKQCYLEYPDGKIILVAIKSPVARDFTVIRELSAVERMNVLQRFDFSI